MGAIIACYVVGLLSYVLLFIYDYNSISKNYKTIKSFFLLGSLCNIGSSIAFSIFSFNNDNIISIIVFSSVAVIFLGLEIYTLFFAIDFKNTYIKDSTLRLAYTKGMYSLCRHPGVLWYILLFVSIGFLVNNLSGVFFFSMMSLLNILYIVYQDYYIFPKTFTNYMDYKKETPFLIPFTKRKVKKI